MDDFQLADDATPETSRAGLDRVFISVDTKASHLAKAQAEAAAKAGKKLDSEADEKKALKRTEFFSALVHVAIVRFVKSGKVASVAEGLHKLLIEVIDPQVNYDILPDPNLFRRACYMKSISAELATHAPSLRILHQGLVELEFGKAGTRLGARSWGNAMRALNFVGIDLSERDISLCFVWSRMAVSGTPSAKDDCLSFEGFLEALCRLSSIKALPTDEEIAERGCSDAGDYWLLMCSSEETKKEYDAMLAERKIGWGGQPAQPLDRCVAHVLAMIVKTIEAKGAAKSKTGVMELNGDLSSVEVGNWLKTVGNS